MTVLLCILAVFIIFIGIILIRTFSFKPKAQAAASEEEIKVDSDKTVKNLCELVKCKTVSYRDRSLEDEKEFRKLVSMLPALYPNVFKVCDFKEITDRALLFKWEGRSHERAAVMMAHYDVVPVDEDGWDKPAFDAIIEEGVIWGRGTLDTKVTMNAILCAADSLIEKGFVPKEDVYFAFSGGEEINADGAEKIVDYFEKNNINLSFVVDEGGAVVENVFPGVKSACGLIGIAEKGMMNVEFKVLSNGGHASAPKPNSPLVSLAKICTEIEDKPFKYHITAPVAKMFDTLGRHSSFVYRMIFANLWLFAPILNIICKKSGGELNALMRTTVAFTQAQGSSASNVIPPVATLTANIRLNPEDNIESALEKLKSDVKSKLQKPVTVNYNDTVDCSDSIKLTLINGMNPSRISETECPEYDKVALAVSSTWKGCIVSPYLMVQCSDSRHYGRVRDRVYRFSAMDLTSEERTTIHGNNERIRIECANKAVEFYLRLLSSC